MPTSTATAGSASITVTAYATDPDVDVTTKKVRPQWWRFNNPHASLLLYVSFDGTNDHHVIDPAAGGSATVKATNEKRVWFRLGSAGTVAASWSAMPPR